MRSNKKLLLPTFTQLAIGELHASEMGTIPASHVRIVRSYTGSSEFEDRTSEIQIYQVIPNARA